MSIDRPSHYFDGAITMKTKTVCVDSLSVLLASPMHVEAKDKYSLVDRAHPQ